MQKSVPQLLTLEDAAEELGLSVSQLRWLRSQKTGPVGARIGKRVYYRPEDLRQWVDSHFPDQEEACDG